jgi:hypothetical protein
VRTKWPPVCSFRSVTHVCELDADAPLVPTDVEGLPHISPVRGVAVLVKTGGLNLVGVIQEIRTHALLIAVKRALERGCAVSIEFGGESRSGEVVSCRPGDAGYDLCVFAHAQQSDRRKSDRFPVTCEAQISADSLSSSEACEIADASVSGIGLKTAVPVQIKEIVSVETETTIAFGVVRHCRRMSRENRFHVGVEIFHTMPKEARKRHHPDSHIAERLFH